MPDGQPIALGLRHRVVLRWRKSPDASSSAANSAKKCLPCPPSASCMSFIIHSLRMSPSFLGNHPQLPPSPKEINTTLCTRTPTKSKARRSCRARSGRFRLKLRPLATRGFGRKCGAMNDRINEVYRSARHSSVPSPPAVKSGTSPTR